MRLSRKLWIVLACVLVWTMPLGLVLSTGRAQENPATPESAATDGGEAIPVDSVPPQMSPHDDVAAPAVDATGAVVEFVVPEAVDDVDGAVAVTCLPESGSLFPLGAVVVICAAIDVAGNGAQRQFTVTVSDQTPPEFVPDENLDVVVDAADENGIAVEFVTPVATDNVDGEVAVSCDYHTGDLFPVGETVVTCAANDAAGNPALPRSFKVTVNVPPTPTAEPSTSAEPTLTEVPTQTGVPTGTPTDSTSTVTSTPQPDSTATATPTPKTRKPTATPPPSATPTSTVPVRAPLELPWPPPDGFTLAGDGGPLGPLAAIWGNQDYPVSQEFGHTEFSIANASWYAYGLDYGLDGYAHTGLDIGMPAGTPLYAPVEGTVKISGGTPYFTFYGNGAPGVGELLIETKEGHEVILGHMGRIAVEVGDEVKIGDFVGLSGGDNGDHLHLEVREKQEKTDALRLVDPRKSFVMDRLEKAQKAQQESITPTPEPGAPRDRPRG